ncbi:A/G-specific adenine glycosylase [Actinomycetaceae bacterium L2_0104]
MFFALSQWFARHSRPLPWREAGTDAWSILVCEVMSQQTPVVRVLPQWERWMERWPTPAELAAASPAEVIVAWDRLGYPRRALRLRECALAVVERFGGELPHGRDDLLSLPGIGPYTADAIIAFAYRERSTVLDTNIRRVIARLNGEEFPPPSLKKAEIARAEALVPLDGEEAAQWNAAIMELGALVCTARNPRCEQCPLSDHCRWLAAGKPSSTQERRVQKFTGTHREARGKIMAVLRSAQGPVDREILFKRSRLTAARFDVALESLVGDGLASSDANGYRLPEG